LDGGKILQNIHVMGSVRNNFENHAWVWSKFYSNRWVYECRNKFFEEGSLRIFKISIFKEASKLDILIDTQKNLKTTSAYTESSALTIKAFQKIFIS
jgi:hypothetical protein